MKLAKKHNLKVMEDNAECYLVLIKVNYPGQLEIVLVLVYSSKHITSGEGGIIITNDDVLEKNKKSYVIGYAGVSAKSAK